MYRLLPAFGILAFVGVFIVASFLYPGGSQFDHTSSGFSWVHNYWCNLLYVEAINGELNPARPVAMLGMGFLCASLALFFYWFPKYYSVNKIWDSIIKISGLLSMLLAISISTENHDIMTTLSSVVGMITLIGIIVSLYVHKRMGFMMSAILGVLLIALNIYIYYSGNAFQFLPTIQKITFVIILLWIILLNTTFLKRSTLI